MLSAFASAQKTKSTQGIPLIAISPCTYAKNSCNFLKAGPHDKVSSQNCLSFKSEILEIS